ncbi:protein containing Prepilin-type cleavage/methylation [bacterium]|nr:protein containing Prepilin-type cleavage/methylation [bacterium]
MIPVTRPKTEPTTHRLAAYTLVELLIVLAIMVLLAAVALPTVKDLLANQQIAKTARNMSAFMDKARSRAIAEGKFVGVRLERLNTLDPVSRAQSIRIRELTSVPPYTGDASNAFAYLTTNTGYTNANLSYLTIAEFNPFDNALLALSASMVAQNTPLQINDPTQPGYVLTPKSEPNDDPSAPIRSGDYIELPGGRLVPFKIQYRALNAGAGIPVKLYFDLSEMRTAGTKSFPSGNPIFPSGGRRIKYKIHRRPVVSTSAPYSLPRGVAVDLNYSGTGMSGNEFAPSPLNTDIQAGANAKPIDIIFGPDGGVVSITNAFSDVPSFPQGQIFICLGDSDGIRPDNLFTPDKKAPANLVSLESTWVVINPGTGRVVSSPFSSVSSLPAVAVIDPYDASLDPAIAEARLLANFADTVDIE